MIAGALSRQAIHDARERTILIGESIRRSGYEVERRTAALAMALHARGLGGRRIGLWYWNAPAAIEAFLAVEWVGGTRVPVDPGAPADETAAIFAAAGVDAVLTDREHFATSVQHLLLHDDAEPLSAPGSLDPVTVSPQATLMLYPRMASRGELMAVPISYANWVAAMEVNMALYRSGAYGPPLDGGECFLTAQQIMHGTGFIGTFPFLCMGLPQVLLRRYNAADAVSAIISHGVTSTFFVPGMVARLTDVVAESGLRVSPPLRRVLYGGAPATPTDLRRAIEVVGPVLIQLYGRFEGGWPLSILSPEDHLAEVGGDPLLGRSCGRPIAQTEINIRPIPGRPSGDAGELCVRNGMVVREAADPDGWCALGDIVRRDENGYLYLGGRLDGMINTGSYHVYPREVEDAIGAVAGVREALVRGEPDPVWGQAVTAYVVLAPEAPAHLVETLRRALGRRLASYKIPKRFHLVSSLREVPAAKGTDG
jgi:fatty-acyl-CoA synthase